jgi:dUTP pyrophosphatase
MQIQITNKSKHALPSYETDASAGMDLRANIDESITLKPLERTIVKTGLFIALPVGFEAQVRPRSGLAAKNGITVLNAPLIIAKHERAHWEEVEVLSETKRGTGGFGSTGK